MNNINYHKNTNQFVTKGQAVDYTIRNIVYTETTLLDDNGRAIMMEWEKPLMEVAAKTICKGGGKILNVGFGMGYIDDAIQKENIEHHTIIECHPTVWKKMKADGWLDKPNVECIFGKWQEVLPRLEKEGRMFDGVYFDTWAEDDGAFHANMWRLINPGGYYSFFNKTEDPVNQQMNPRYIILHNWYDDPEMIKIKLENVPTQAEQNTKGTEGWYWNPDIDIYWHPIWKRKDNNKQ